MKKSKMMMAAMISGIGIAGAYYLKKHPEAIDKMRRMMMDVNRNMYNKLDNDF